MLYLAIGFALVAVVGFVLALRTTDMETDEKITASMEKGNGLFTASILIYVVGAIGFLVTFVTTWA